MVCGQGVEVDVAGFVAQQQLAFGGLKSSEGDGDGIGFLAGQSEVVGSVVAVMVDEPVSVTSGDAFGSEVAGDDVAGGDDGVGAHGRISETGPRRRHPDECFLGEVVDQMRIAHLRRDQRSDDVVDLDERLIGFSRHHPNATHVSVVKFAREQVPVKAFSLMWGAGV